MKNKIFALLSLSLALLTVLTGCSLSVTPYVTNDEDNYTVSVRYDANGGIFTTNTSVIVDSYNLDEIKAGTSENAEIALISPDNAARGNDAFKATKNGCFLAGWYKERIETTDSSGNKAYTYSGRWNFEEDVLSVSRENTYSSSEPVLTLYAAWVPLFEIEFYDKASGELIEELKFDPNEGLSFELPFWDEETGAIQMNRFPERQGYTFECAYVGDEAEDILTKITDSVITHPGTVDLATATAENSVLKLYVDYTEGEWYRIYNAQQFLESADLSGNYEIFADLDFADEIWPTAFMYGNFTGSIKGNGHKFKNIELTQTNNSKVNAGLFGNFTESASVSDLTFENVNFTIKSGTRVVGASFGIFAGTLASEAEVKNVSILKSSLQIDSSCYFGVDDYSIGLVCGMGKADVFEKTEITAKAVGDNPESIKIQVSGNDVTLEFVNELFY